MTPAICSAVRYRADNPSIPNVKGLMFDQAEIKADYWSRIMNGYVVGSMRLSSESKVSRS